MRDKKAVYQKLGITVILLGLAFILSMKSGFDFFTRGGTNPNDGDVFNYIGYLMGKGYVPYRDIFDHKGMFLYALQFIGSKIGQYRGVYAIEVLFLAGAVFACYFFARRFCAELLSIFTIALVFARYSVCGYGNCIEEYSLLFQIVALYFFYDFFDCPGKYIKRYEYTRRGSAGEIIRELFDFRVVLLGLCFSCVFFMKANLCAVWLVFCVAIFSLCVKEKQWSSLMRFVASFLVGFAAVALPIAVYLIKNNAVGDFIYDYFVVNGLYTSNEVRVSIKDIVKAAITFTNTTPCILSLLIMALELKRKDKYFLFNITYLLYMALLVGLVAMSGQTYPKMEIALLPMYVYPMCRLTERLESSKWRQSGVSEAVAGWLIISIIIPLWGPMVKSAGGDILKYYSSPKPKGYFDNEIVQYIKENTEERDQISVFGNECRIFLYSDRLPNSKYIFFLDPVVDSRIVDDYFRELESSPPKIIVISSKYTGDRSFAADRMESYLKEKKYKLVIDDDKPIYERQEEY